MIEDVLDREGMDYKVQRGSSGEQLNVKECPFCGGTGWKVYINRDTGLGNCFHGSCQERFNKWRFVHQIVGGANSETFRYFEKLAAENGYRKPGKAVAVETFEAGDWKLPTSFPLPLAGGQNLKYLLKRNVNNDTAAYFGLRYCVDGWFNYTKPDGSPSGMFFGNRVIIPVYDLDGTLVTFQGRDISGTSDRKYLFPPGLPGTGRFLYNGQNAMGKRRVVMCEGVFDVIRTWINTRDTEFHDLGVVGSFGISLSSGQDGADQINKFLRLKKQGLEQVIIMWDGERNAFRRSLDAAMAIRRLGLSVWIAQPPEGKDPGELSQMETIASLKGARTISARDVLALKLGV